ncbi:MAG: outer membrane protein assembly factor BamD [Pseudomonadota bacterium]
MRNLVCLIILGSVLAVSGCGGSNKKAPEQKSAAALYSEARLNITQSDYDHAIESLNAIEARYPLDQHASKALLALVYANFMKEDYTLAQATSERFIQLYPKNRHVDYAYYMKGLSHYFEDILYFDRYFEKTRGYRDMTHSQMSFFEFGQFIKRFPGSRYAPDAHKRMIFLRNQLAVHEIEAADYYYDRAAYVAAARRYTRVVLDFHQTTQVPQALYGLSKTYEQMGLKDLAKTSADVLQYNYPQSIWAQKLSKTKEQK